MLHEGRTNLDYNEPLVYEIRLKGHLDDQWAAWFGGLSIVLDDSGDTLLTGPVADQAALHGLLRKVRDLGLTLLSVQCVGVDLKAASEITKGTSG